jgi:hypothetical protein
VAQTKQRILDARHIQHPERFVAGPSRTPLPPPRVEINPVTPHDIAAGVSTQVNFPTLPRVAAAQAKYELSLN